MSTQTKIKILILGGGFCGIRTAQILCKKLKKHAAEITLVNRHDYQVYFADLYEVSTAFNPHITDHCLTALHDSVAIRIADIFKKTPVKFIQAEILKIDHQKKQAHLKNYPTDAETSDETEQILPYNYLVVSLGSVANFYGIPGLEKHSYKLKTLEDAMKIDCELDAFFKEKAASKHKSNPVQKFRFVIGGGGFSGVEFATEVFGYLKKLCHKYDFDQQVSKIWIIEAGPQLLNAGKKLSDVVEKRLESLGIECKLNTKITSCHDHEVQLETINGEITTIKTDMIFWTGGISPNPLLQKSFEKLSPRGLIEVKTTLESKEYPHVYAGGDNALIINPQTGQPVPQVAQLAIQEAEIIARNIVADIKVSRKKIYHPHFKGFIVPLGGKYAVFKKGGIILKGLIPYLMRKAVDLNYFMTVLPKRKAIRKWRRSGKIFAKND